MSSRHLDIGCGLIPRNPYRCHELFGCDIRDIGTEQPKTGFNYKRANLSIEPIPFEDNFFDSISAFDFLEHIPRQSLLPSGQIFNPFVNLMSEIHRTLKPGGRFLAVTPCYPHPSAFVDPTHVNFITDKTHEYFTDQDPGAKMYGFNGHFKKIKVFWDAPKNAYETNAPLWKQRLVRVHRRFFAGGLSHIRWELEAIKPT